MEDNTQSIKNSEKIVALENRVDKMENWMGEMAKDIKQIRERLLGRPSWFVLTIISLLTAACAGLGSWVTAVLRLVIEVK